MFKNFMAGFLGNLLGITVFIVITYLFILIGFNEEIVNAVATVLGTVSILLATLYYIITRPIWYRVELFFIACFLGPVFLILFALLLDSHLLDKGVLIIGTQHFLLEAFLYPTSFSITIAGFICLLFGKLNNIVSWGQFIDKNSKII